MLTQATEAVEHALEAGNLTVPDPQTGYHRSMYAVCPIDGRDASVWRITRGANHAIVGVTMHCVVCGHVFEAPPEKILLR